MASEVLDRGLWVILERGVVRHLRFARPLVKLFYINALYAQGGTRTHTVVTYQRILSP